MNTETRTDRPAWLASRAAAIPEVCGPDAAAYFDPDDPAALASAMADLLSDEAGRARLVAAGHRRADGLQWSVQAQLLLNLMRSRFPAVVPRPSSPDARVDVTGPPL